MVKRRKNDATITTSWTYRPGWVEPPGTQGYLIAQRRQLREFFLWAVLILVVLFAIAWPFVYYTLIETGIARSAISELGR